MANVQFEIRTTIRNRMMELSSIGFNELYFVMRSDNLDDLATALGWSD